MTQSEFEHIAQQLRSQMLKVALDFFGSQDDAEDVAQDAMVQLWHYCRACGEKLLCQSLSKATGCPAAKLYRYRTSGSVSSRHVRLSSGTLGGRGHTTDDDRGGGTVEAPRTGTLRGATDRGPVDRRSV